MHPTQMETTVKTPKNSLVAPYFSAGWKSVRAITGDVGLQYIFELWQH